MRRTLVILLATVLPILATAQSFSERRQADKEKWYEEKRKTEQREQEVKPLPDSVYYSLSASALREKRFVLEADQVVFKRGRNAFVNSSTNFVSLFDNEAVVQISPLESVGGFNGVGGITLDGTASNIKIHEDKKKNIRLSMNVTGVGISAQVEIRLTHGSDKANVTINLNFNSRRTELIGRIVPYENSEIFKGTSL